MDGFLRLGTGAGRCKRTFRRQFYLRARFAIVLILSCDRRTAADCLSSSSSLSRRGDGVAMGLPYWFMLRILLSNFRLFRGDRDACFLMTLLHPLTALLGVAAAQTKRKDVRSGFQAMTT